MHAITLDWTDDLILGDPRTDVTHQEFIAYLNATAAATGDAQLSAYQQLLQHTVEHFAQEERWMRACGISEDFCHFSQHASVLNVMHEVERRALAGEAAFIPSMLAALVEWFPSHASSMDAGLVGYLQEKGFDTAAECFHDGVLPSDSGAAACSHHEPGATCN